jgi:hypothetical protein
MLYRDIIAVCSEIHTKHINTLCGQSVGLLSVILVVHIVTTGLYKGLTFLKMRIPPSHDRNLTSLTFALLSVTGPVRVATAATDGGAEPSSLR